MPAAQRPGDFITAWLARCVLSLGMLFASTAGTAAELPEAQAKAIRAVIEAQLEAFAADDAERAFSYASPSIHQMFGTAPEFMAMVQGRYSMLVKPESVVFLLPSTVRGNVIQEVLLRDREGRLWRAAYRLEPIADGSWRINACVVAPDDGKSSA